MGTTVFIHACTSPPLPLLRLHGAVDHAHVNHASWNTQEVVLKSVTHSDRVCMHFVFLLPQGTIPWCLNASPSSSHAIQDQ